MKKDALRRDAGESRWLLLIHQIPPKPDYLRVKIGRRLTKIGAIAIKNSVYALPRGDVTREDLEWILREIAAGGGDAYVCEARFVEGLDDAQVEDLFRSARDADYEAVAVEAREIAKRVAKAKRLDDSVRSELLRELERLRAQVRDIFAIDYFGASGRVVVEGVLATLETRITAGPAESRPRTETESYRGRTWVTRRGIHVDRMASAWLIRRFIDREATFRFVDAKAYRHKRGELRFDMYDAEFTHEGDACSFEVLLERLGPRSDPALRAIADLVHDLDVKDGKYGRAEAAGLSASINGLCWSETEDAARLKASGSLFDSFYEFFRRRSASRAVADEEKKR